MPIVMKGIMVIPVCHGEEADGVSGRLEAMAKNLVIIGGGAAGPSVAAEAKRGDSSLNVTILEQGEHVSYAA